MGGKRSSADPTANGKLARIPDLASTRRKVSRFRPTPGVVVPTQAGLFRQTGAAQRLGQHRQALLVRRIAGDQRLDPEAGLELKQMASACRRLRAASGRVPVHRLKNCRNTEPRVRLRGTTRGEQRILEAAGKKYA